MIHWICFLHFNPKCNNVTGTDDAANKPSSCQAWAQLWQPNLQVRIDTLVEMATIHKNGLRVTLAQLNAAVDRDKLFEARHVQAPIRNTPCKTPAVVQSSLTRCSLWKSLMHSKATKHCKTNPGSFFWSGRKQLCTVCKTIVQLLSLDHWDVPSTSENASGYLWLIIYPSPNSQPQTQDSKIQASFISSSLR